MRSPQGDSSDDEGQLSEARAYWDEAAASFDDEPDHGLAPPRVRRAWTALLKEWLPANRAAVLDMGCGTGSLSILLAELGHDVTGIDLSPEMIRLAECKASESGQTVDFNVMDAAQPLLPSASFDVVVSRHVLWTLPDLPRVLRRWAAVLKPYGRLILIEGFWSTGAGLHAADIVDAFPPSVTVVAVQDLGGQQDYWDKPVTDERYVVIADVKQS